MGIDGYTELNPGSGGNVLDETIVSYPTDPMERRRERVQIGGCLAEQLAEVFDSPPSSTDYGLVVRPIHDGQKLTVGLELPGDEVHVCDLVTLVGVSTETTIASYTVPVGKTFHAIGWVASGDVDAVYRFYIDGALQMVARSSVAMPTVKMSFFLAAPTGTAGQTVSITGFHTAKSQSGGVITAQFDATILGYLT